MARDPVLGGPPDPADYGGELGWVEYWLECMIFLIGTIVRGLVETISQVVRYFMPRPR